MATSTRDLKAKIERTIKQAGPKGTDTLIRENVQRRGVIPSFGISRASGNPTDARAAVEELANLALDGDLAQGIDDLFHMLDGDRSGALDADELIAAIGQIGAELPPDVATQLQRTRKLLDYEAVSSLIREIDLNGDGMVQPSEFKSLLRPRTQTGLGDAFSDSRPHLTLYFDVNQTILMVDSVTGAGVSAVLNATIANAAWGSTDIDGNWVLESTKPSVMAPCPGMTTYATHVATVHKTTESDTAADVKTKRASVRQAIRSFTNSDQPGVRLARHVQALDDAMAIPLEVRKANPSEELARIGLTDGRCLLLPSFLFLLHTLKREGRSFSVCFRTFGQDMGKIVEEYNAFCRGHHPLVPGHGVVMDGSDGKPDMSMSLEGAGCGTWVRTPEDMIYLVLGSTLQPPQAEVGRTVDDLRSYYARTGTKVNIISGLKAASERLSQLLGANGTPRTLALRDYYPAWQASGFQAHGGKPIVVDPSPKSMQIFFDDHITAHDAHIVDARRSEDLAAPPLPIAATLGINLVRAEPLKSIRNKSYFVNEVAAAEKKWRLQQSRRDALASILRAHAAALRIGATRENVTARPEHGGPSPPPQKRYVPHLNTDDVMRAPKYAGVDD